MDRQVVFFGSSPFSVPVLQQLIDAQVPIAGVVTFPDKPAGRHLLITPNPVKVLAQDYHLSVFESPQEFLSSAQNDIRYSATIALVAAYGRIIKPEVLSIFNNQIYNIHPSLLPKYRGPSPLQQQILDGVTETGVTIIRMDELMDHGPILVQTTAPLLPDDTAVSLGNRLFELGGNLFLDYLKNKPPYHLKAQDDSQATVTSKLTRESGFIKFENFKKSLEMGILNLEIASKFRAFIPWPGVWTIDPNGKRIKLISINPPLVQPEGTSKPIDFNQI